MSEQNPVEAVIGGEEATLEGLFPELAEYLSNPEAAPPSKAQPTEPAAEEPAPAEEVPPPYGLNDDTLLRHAEEHFSPPAQPEGDEGETPVPPPESPPAAEEPAPAEPEPTAPAAETPPEPPPAEQPTTIQIGDDTYRVDELQQLLQFRAELERNPQLQRAVIEGLTGPQQQQPQPQPQPQAQAPTLPEDLDPEDPTFKALYPALQALQNQNAQLNNSLQTFYNQQLNEQIAQREGVINRAKLSFAKDHDLSTAEVDKLTAVAEKTNVVGTYMSGTHPITGQPVRPDPLAAVELALDVAYAATPEYQQREFERKIERLKDDHKRKTKLSAISGNSGSQPRQQPAPRNDTERRTQMIEAVAESMFGGGQSG